jgi:oxalyl-CoA decarboxylase
VVRDIIKANPDAILVNEGANALDFTRSIVDMYNRASAWTSAPGHHGHRHVCRRGRRGQRRAVIAIEGDSAFGFSGMEVGPSAATSFRSAVSSATTASTAEPTLTAAAPMSHHRVRQGARYDKLMEAFGGVGVHADTRPSCGTPWRKPSARASPLINAVIDKPPAPKRSHHEPESQSAKK